MSLLNDVIDNTYLSFLKGKENLIIDALKKHGLDWELVKDDMEWCVSKNDPFQHLLYKRGSPDEIRIISFKEEKILYDDDKGKFKINSDYY